MPDEYLFSIKSADGNTKGIITKSGRCYYLEWIGWGIKRRIRKKSVDRLSKSDLRINEDSGK